MQCLARRAKTLCLLYGTYDESFDYYIEENRILLTERNCTWQDFSHYSSRQKDAMSLGGAVGNFKLSGTFTLFEQSLFDFAKIANAGKNTNFGLGQINFWKNWN